MIVQKQATIDRFEGKQAIISLENGQELAILREELGTINEGEEVVVQIMPTAEAALEKAALARTLLNQILNDEIGDKKSEG